MNRSLDDEEHNDTGSASRVVSASLVIHAPAEVIFEWIADPSRQPAWDGNDNLREAATGQRIHAVGDVFVMTLSGGAVRHNHVVEFIEGRRIAWMPSEPDRPRPGHLWRWELDEVTPGETTVTHTYDWTGLDDPKRLERARATSSGKLAGSITRLAHAVHEEAARLQTHGQGPGSNIELDR